jgi:6-pyruvoyltetrahydropterin/6-carboxytetrahydropterin synthase
MFEVSVEHTFAAAHSLRNYHGKCENLHGHNYRVQVSVEGEALNETGLLLDFKELKHWLRQTSEYLDHQFINELKPFDVVNPSAENLAKFFYDEIQRNLPSSKVSAVRVWETDTSCATYRP